MENLFIDEILEKYEYESIHEMLFEMLPRGYNIPSAFSNISDLPSYPEKTKITVFGYINSYDISPTRGAISRIKAKLCKDGVSVDLVWTVSKAKAKGMVFGLTQKSKDEALVQVTGKVGSFTLPNGYNYKFIEQPQLNSITMEENKSQAAVLVPEPLYKLKEGIKVNQVQNAFREIFTNWDNIYKSNFLPTELEKELGLGDLKESIQYAHGLKPIAITKFNDFLNYEGFRKRILVEKIWTIMKNGYSNSKMGGNSNFNITDQDINNLKIASATLEFTLTNDQKKTIWGMLKHFEEKTGSKNLVFGDVGSGKTIVAIFLAFVMLKKKKQVAIIAPTSILAKQHFEETKEMFPDENIFIVHSKTKKKEKDKINELLEEGIPAIIFGTSSVNKLFFTNLSMIVIDEEQKFGVKDKEVLYKKSNSQAQIILMTATPIPRTLASAMFSDFSVFKIEQKPAMQKDRITKLINPSDMSENEINEIKERMRNKEQTLIIVPSIVSNDMVSVASAKEKYGKLFPEFTISTINGRMKALTIEKNTEEFMSGNIDILIATTMVDAGFSNKMLSHVIVENAERFGISQLHQIRGRCGRGNLQGYCYLSTAAKEDSLKEATRERLKSLVESENGFELSMKDIQLRGSGDLMGTQQSGSDVNLLEWLKEIEIIGRYLKDRS